MDAFKPMISVQRRGCKGTGTGAPVHREDAAGTTGANLRKEQGTAGACAFTASCHLADSPK